MTRRPSRQTAAVVRALAADLTQWRHGYELGQEVALKAGSLYPILMRLSERGLLESCWEADPPVGRPARHLYRLSGEGIRYAREVAVVLDPADSADRAQLRTRPQPREAW